MWERERERCYQTMRLSLSRSLLLHFLHFYRSSLLDYHRHGEGFDYCRRWTGCAWPTKCLGKLSCQPLFSVSNACKPSTTYFFLKFLRLVFLLNQFLMADKTMSTPLQFLYFYFFKFHKWSMGLGIIKNYWVMKWARHNLR